ncbi:alpha-glucosidase/alpha-galactosidase [Dictyobacter vulcani]|uniref:Alpha-glucosidase/alpha-galactosidase n=1 Tax=Dictyobacter vulcani TaxID=2607529 RepID=A0A5J4L0K1_9CHLR|nr:alpha-galactosidase [Dictyobacter vulcani]GER90996.1 alpha-glucosidase/alpha-galactosidase [Dictyobacter vulcani]
MTKITFMGAGSTVFARQLMTDILHIDGLNEGTFALVDIDASRLELAHQIAEKLVKHSGRNWKVESSTQRRDILPGTNFLINTIEVAGMANVRHDFDIPMKYGVDQCIGDTIGPGGIFKALRTGPAWLDILHDAEELCPNALVLNYTNPMSILTFAASLATKMQTVGLCHSVQGSSRQLAGYLDVPYEELEWRCAGINHNAWFTVLRHNGEDMYPRLRERMKQSEIYEKDPVRLEIMLHFGAFVTESSGHFSEYVPYFRKRPELIEKYCRPGYLGETGFYANNWPTWRANNEQYIKDLLDDSKELPFKRSHEYGSDIVEAVTQHRSKVIYGNVRNAGLIDNLPDGCVEVACLVDRNGIQPTHFGKLPEQLAAMNKAHMSVHSLMCEALLKRDKQAARYALMIDPLTAAVCSPAEISSLFDEMWEAEREYLQFFE